MSQQVIHWKHYTWLFLWFFCLFYGIAYHSLGASIAFLLIFFIASTYKKLVKSIFIGLACTVLASVPYINILFMIVGLVCILLRIRFLINHWRILLVGVYAYGVHFMLFLANSFRRVKDVTENIITGANMTGMESAQSVASNVSDTITFTGIVVALVMTLILHIMIKKLYKRNYSTERVFLVMGLSPLIIVATVFPFLSHLKIGGIDITGDSFLDADSLEDASDSLTGVETGFMGAASHGTHVLASRREQSESTEETNGIVEEEQNHTDDASHNRSGA